MGMAAPPFISGSEWWSFIGGILEFVGLCVVIYGIDKNQKEAGREGLWSKLRDVVGDRLRRLLSRLGRQKPQTQTLYPSSILSQEEAGTFRARPTVDFGGTVEEQLKKIKTELLLHERQIGNIDAALANEREARETADSRERSQTERALARLDEGLKAVAAGDLFIEATGVTLFMLGVVAQTIGGVTG